MFPVAVVTFFLRHWKQMVAAVAFLLLTVGTYAFGYSHGANNIRLDMLEQRNSVAQAHRRAMEFAISNAREQAIKDQTSRAELERVLQEERLEKEKLRSALDRSQLLTRPEPTNENPHPCPRYSDAWRLCWNANWSGSPADRAACEAAGRAMLGGDRHPGVPPAR